MFEHMLLASPVRARSDDAAIAAAREGRVTLENRGEFRDTAWLRAAWEATRRGRGGRVRATCRCPRSSRATRPRSSIPGWRLPDGAGGERWLTLRFLTADATEWAGGGLRDRLGPGPARRCGGRRHRHHTRAGPATSRSMTRGPSSTPRSRRRRPCPSGAPRPTTTGSAGWPTAGPAGGCRAHAAARRDRPGRRRGHRARDVDDGHRARDRAHPAAQPLARRRDPRRGVGGDPGRDRGPRPGRHGARAGRGPRGVRVVRARAARDVPRSQAGRPRRALVVDDHRAARRLHPPAGERRPRRHALVPRERRRRRLDPRGPRPPRPGLRDPPHRRRSRRARATTSSSGPGPRRSSTSTPRIAASGRRAAAPTPSSRTSCAAAATAGPGRSAPTTPS